MKDKDIQNALEKINDDLMELEAEIFADSVMDSRVAKIRVNLKRSLNKAISHLQNAEDEVT